LRRDRGPQAELALHLAGREPGPPALHQEAVHALLAVLAQLGPHHRDVGDVAVGDPALRAVEHVLVTLAARRGAHAGWIRAEVGLGQAEAADGRARRQLRQPLLALLLRSVGVDRIHHEPRLDAREGPETAIAALQLLVDQAVGDLAEAGAAVLLGQRRAEEAERRQPGNDLHREAALAKRLRHEWDVFVLDEAPRGVAHHAF